MSPPHGLAGARFADHADDLSARDLHAGLGHHGVAVAGGQRQAVDIEQDGGCHTRLRMRGSSRSRKASPSRVRPSSDSEIARPGKMASQAAWPM
ncbi:hypothetical protein G6F64_014978 [Rhizopus arrhizus]|uniref:Uncharacterized protein n=1 Tax=Rhizopus oryzae TaxID=64495 RepID=A0A9P6WSZ9_RHIOR|nr:hypothetical protein G6F64_014978 [Rhizopus arrhizus]